MATLRSFPASPSARLENIPAASPRPHRLAALLSALLPGSGQLLVGQIASGLAFLGLWALWLAAFVALRIPRSYWGYTFLVLAGVAITELAAFRVLRARSGGMRRVSTLMLFVLFFAALASAAVWQDLAMHAAGFRFVYVGSGWMDKTIAQGDRLVADTRAYRTTPPQREDIVMLPARSEPGKFAFKRVLAIPGDTIEARNGQVLVNGQPLHETYSAVPGVIIPALYNFAPVTVPRGQLFVMGDNRDGRLDPQAQWFGLIPASSVLGKPLYLYSSVNDKEGMITIPADQQ